MNLFDQFLLACKHDLSNNLRKILFKYDIGFYDLIETAQDELDEYRKLRDTLNGELEKIKHPVSIKSIAESFDSLDNDIKIHICFMKNIEELFDDYKEGYLSSTYSMLHFDLYINSETYYKFLNNNEKLDLNYSRTNGLGLLSKVTIEKLNRNTLDIQNETLFELIRG